MKSTGVVRRIDELGRIVVPKEMRRILRIREGDSIEISAESDSIVLKKYSLVESIDNFIIQYIDAVYASSKKEIIVVDTEKVLAVSNGLKKGFIGRKIDIHLEDLLRKNDTIVYERGHVLNVCESFSVQTATIIKPITVFGDVIGGVIVLGDNIISETEKMLSELTAIFIGKYLES